MPDSSDPKPFKSKVTITRSRWTTGALQRGIGPNAEFCALGFALDHELREFLGLLVRLHAGFLY